VTVTSFDEDGHPLGKAESVAQGGWLSPPVQNGAFRFEVS
jgi:hypothetical protein